MSALRWIATSIGLWAVTAVAVAPVVGHVLRDRQPLNQPQRGDQ